jgi:ankyrin repeat protein
MKASERGNLDMVKLLLEHGAYVNGKDCRGRTLLKMADRHLAVQKVLENGADLNDKNNKFDQELILASHRNDLEAVRTLLSQGADENAKDSSGEIALIVAASKNYLEVVQLMLNNHVDFDVMNYKIGNTAMMEATIKGHFKIVKLLLESGADANVRDSFNRTAVIQAASYGHFDIVKLLLENYTYDDRVSEFYYDLGESLIEASSNGHFEIVKLLLNSDAHVNYNGDSLFENQEKTALIRAVFIKYFCRI